MADLEMELPQVVNWREGQELIGASDLQVKFVQALCQGASKTGAARAAGYRGEGAGLRSIASRIAKSHKVMALLSWAKSNGEGPSEVEGDPKELRRILWRHARSADPNRSIRGTEALSKLDERDRERAALEDQHDPIETLALLATHSPVLAAVLSVEHKLPWPKNLDRFAAERELEGIRKLIEKHANGSGADARGSTAAKVPTTPTQAVG